MALSRMKRWARNEILLSTDLNAEFDNLVNNAQSLVFPLTQDLDVGGYLMNDTGFTAPIQLHENLQSLDGKYANEIGAAIAGIGLSSVTLMIAAPATVSGTYSIPGNIHLWFVGQGNLSINGGSTLTLVAPSQITATSSQSLFSGAGSVLFTQAGVVSPCWWGFNSGGSAATNADAYNACTASLSVRGGVVVIPPTGTAYQVDDTLTHPAKPISVIGAHPELSIIESTATASVKHCLTFTRSNQVKNITVRTSANLTASYQMYAIRTDLDGVTVSGGNLAMTYENIKVRGFNSGIYVDGGDAYNVDRVHCINADVKVYGDGAVATGMACLAFNRCNQVMVQLSQCDQNNNGEHALYFFGSRQIIIDGLKVSNATMTEAQAFKFVGNGVAPDDDQAYGVWALANIEITNCTNGILCSTYGTETLEALIIRNIKIDDVDCSAGISGAVMASASGTSSIRAIKMDNISLRNIGRQGLHVSAGVGATLGSVQIENINAYNWSTSSPGTYTLVGTNGDGAYGPIHVSDVYADGNGNGRSILNIFAQANSVRRVRYTGLEEVNTTDTGRPVSLATGDGTPSMAIGNWFIQPNATPQNITAYDHLEANQTYYIRFSTANTTLKDGSNLQLAGSVDYTPPANTFMSFYCSDGTALYEVSRSAN